MYWHANSPAPPDRRKRRAVFRRLGTGDKNYRNIIVGGVSWPLYFLPRGALACRKQEHRSAVCDQQTYLLDQSESSAVGTSSRPTPAWRKSVSAMGVSILMTPVAISARVASRALCYFVGPGTLRHPITLIANPTATNPYIATPMVALFVRLRNPLPKPHKIKTFAQRSWLFLS